MVYGHLWRTFGSSGLIRLSYVLKIVSQVCKLVFLPVALSLIIARLTQGDYDGAKQAVLFFVAASLTLGVLIPLVKYIGMLGENRTYRRITAEYFERLVRTDMDFFTNNLSGYITSSIRHYVDSSLLIARHLRDIYLSTVLSITLPLIVIAWVDWQLGLIALGLSIVQAIYVIWASSALDMHRKKSRELYKLNSGRMADIISNIVAVRSSAQEDAFTAKVQHGAEEENDAFSARYAAQAKLTILREGITVIFFGLLLWLTVGRLSGGVITITEAILVVTYISTIMTGIYALAENFNEHDDFLDKVLPAFEVLNRQNHVIDLEKPVTFSNPAGQITFKGVTFSYHKNRKLRPVFNNFSLDIPKGQKVGVVGLSGAGKSTLAKLLLRFNDVDEGEVLIDGVNIKNVRQTDIHHAIAYVPQEPLLFHSSIKENVLVSRPDASDSEIRRALRAAHAADFIAELPDGIGSIVGERGVKLSGGQKQRIAIARAVLQHAPIMVLDEATSALDSESEQIIKESFSDVLRGKTAIVVAHRLSTLSEMDRIIVIENGKIAEDGTHQELLEDNKTYAKLWRRQQKHGL